MISMRKIGFFLLGLLVFACVVSTVNATVEDWPDWSQATSYVDSTGEQEVVDPIEDMTVCYVNKSDDHLFFRAEFRGAVPPERELDIYLDTIAGGQTGTDEKGHSLHDLAPDYKVFYGSAPANLYRWDGAAWQHVKDLAYESDLKFVEIAVELASIGNPTFPIGILFISSTEADATDWNSDVGHLRYPQVVGGKVYQSQTWLPALGIVGLLSVFAAVLLSLKRRQR